MKYSENECTPLGTRIYRGQKFLNKDHLRINQFLNRNQFNLNDLYMGSNEFPYQTWYRPLRTELSVATKLS
jgi:hypothetical protein